MQAVSYKKLKYSKKQNLALNIFLAAAVNLGISTNNVMAENPHKDESQAHISVELVSEKRHLSAGESTRIGVHFVPEHHWHVYWLNPGDTGLSPTVDWKLPEGFTISDLQWPFPQSIPVAHLTNYGYEGDTALYATLTAPKDLTKQSNIKINADLSWLVCKEACVPGDTSLGLAFNTADKETNNVTDAATDNAMEATNHSTVNDYAVNILDQAKSQTPKSQKVIGSDVKLNKTDNLLALDLYADSLLFKDAKTIEIFVKTLDLVEYSKPLKIHWKSNRLRWQQTLSEYFTTLPENIEIVVVVDESKSYEFSLSAS